MNSVNLTNSKESLFEIVIDILELPEFSFKLKLLVLRREEAYYANLFC